MNSRSSSFSAAPRRTSSRPAFNNRLSFAFSHAEQGEADDENNGEDRQITEEISEIKRYEVCSPLNIRHKLNANFLYQDFTTIGI